VLQLSSSNILRFSNLVVRSWTLTLFTLVVPSCAILRISQASLATVHYLINLIIFLPTPLNKAFNALEFPSVSSSSTTIHSSSSFKTVVLLPSASSTTGCSQPLRTAFQVLLSMDLRKTLMREFQ